MNKAELSSPFSLNAYDFPFSEKLVAEVPAEPRDSSRLMVVDRATGDISHERFRDLPEHLRPGDCLVLNRTKVLPARLVGKKSTGGKAEILLLREIEPGVWSALSSDIKPGARIDWKDGSHASVESLNPEGEWICRFSKLDVRGLMERIGLPPLPPYILKKRRRALTVPAETDRTMLESRPQDRERYQTVYAREEGSVAAPTAGLHFTSELLARLKTRGVRVTELTLHVGHGTFQPLASPDIRDHRMKSEWYRVGPEAAATIRKCRSHGGRVIPVGTTATRTLETFARMGKTEGWTDLFIRPGHEFKTADALVTNFHQPRSTPLVLACAFAGRELMFSAYQEAAANGYRLYSFGDAMLIL